jgi:hypothetical protein
LSAAETNAGLRFHQKEKAVPDEPPLDISMDKPNTTILVIDIGNTNTVLGLYQGDSLRALWRLATNREQTADEYGVVIHNLFALEKLSAADISGVSCRPWIRY